MLTFSAVRLSSEAPVSVADWMWVDISGYCWIGLKERTDHDYFTCRSTSAGIGMISAQIRRTIRWQAHVVEYLWGGRA